MHLAREVFSSPEVDFYEETFVLSEEEIVRFYQIVRRGRIYQIGWEIGASLEESIDNARGESDESETAIEDALITYTYTLKSEVIH